MTKMGVTEPDTAWPPILITPDLFHLNTSTFGVLSFQVLSEKEFQCKYVSLSVGLQNTVVSTELLC